MADQNWLQGVMEWYDTQVAPVMEKVKGFMATVDPEGAQWADTISGQANGEIPLPDPFNDLVYRGEPVGMSDGVYRGKDYRSLDDMLADPESGMQLMGTTALPPASPVGAGPSQAGGASTWPGSYTRAPSGAGSIPVEDMVSPAGKGKLIMKALKYGLPMALTAIPALRNLMPNSMGEGISKAAQAATNITDETVNPELINIAKSSAQDKGEEEKAARQEIEAATSAIKGSGPKEEPFDIEAIAKKYGNPEGGGYMGPETGSVFTEREISKEDLGGLKKTGYVEKNGKKVFIYGRPEEKKTETAGAGSPGGDDNASKITAFENSVIKRMGWDPRTFNPAEEARKAVEAEKDRYFNWTFGGNAHPNYLTQAQAKHWQANLDALYNSKLKEATIKQAQGEKMLSTLVGRFEKEHLGQPIHVKEGENIYTFNKATNKYEPMISGGPKSGKALPAEQAKQIDRVLDGTYMDQVDSKKSMMNNGKVYESLPKTARYEYDELREKATRIMMDSIRKGEPLTAHEAVKIAKGEKGATTAKGNPPSGYKAVPGKFINGKQVYVSPDGRKGWTA